MHLEWRGWNESDVMMINVSGDIGKWQACKEIRFLRSFRLFWIIRFYLEVYYEIFLLEGCRLGKRGDIRRRSGCLFQCYFAGFQSIERDGLRSLKTTTTWIHLPLIDFWSRSTFLHVWKIVGIIQAYRCMQAVIDDSSIGVNSNSLEPIRVKKVEKGGSCAQFVGQLRIQHCDKIYFWQ